MKRLQWKISPLDCSKRTLTATGARGAVSLEHESSRSIIEGLWTADLSAVFGGTRSVDSVSIAEASGVGSCLQDHESGGQLPGSGAGFGRQRG